MKLEYQIGLLTILSRFVNKVGVSMERYRKELYRKEKMLNCALNLKDDMYYTLNDREVAYVEGLIFDTKNMKKMKTIHEELNQRYKNYYALRMRNRLASEMLELMLLLVADQYHWVEKCRSNDRKGDIKINGVKYDIKLQFNDYDEDGRLNPKYIRDYHQRKIILMFPKNAKDYLYTNFIEYFREGMLRLDEIVEDIQRRNYREVIVEDMSSIRYCL